MGKDSRTLPPIPDLAIVAEVIRLAEECEAERHAQRPPEHPEVHAPTISTGTSSLARGGCAGGFPGSLPEETVAGLYAFYRLGDLALLEAGEAAERLR